MADSFTEMKGNQGLLQKITSEISGAGPITFARFMSLALYDPEFGYYMTPRSDQATALGEGDERIGWSGDFYTAPDGYPLLAKALFKQIQEIDELLGHPSPFTVLEMGGGKGLLARDFLRECECFAPDLSNRLRYGLVERSPKMQASQQHHLTEAMNSGWEIWWGSSLQELEPGVLTGVVFSNELVDAFPVHRVKMDGGMLKEIYVDYDGSRFFERAGVLSTPGLAEYLQHHHVELPENYTTEVHLEALEWMSEVGRIFNQGIVLTIDYGHTAQDYFAPERSQGTVLSYYRHRVEPNPYLRIGEQDITAHVNFSTLALAGEQSGLPVTGFTDLMNFLLSLGADELVGRLDPESKEFQSAVQLLNPRGMGRTFKVLIQHKGIESPTLQGLRFKPFFEGVLETSGSKVYS